jgi:2'-hydroxyisoflavone reductase
VRLLVLGGTVYLGRHLVGHALREGHQVTLFHRGRTGTNLFPGVPRLYGDRTPDGDPAGLAALATGAWDAVFDFSGFLPRQVSATARLLAPRIGQYVFMSSIAVYPRSSQAGRTEDAETRDPLPGHHKTFTADTYGPLKVACERAAVAACPGRSTAIRAGLVIGPGDPFGAFPSWALAMAGDGPVPCAARPGQPLQVTDARDLVAFMVRAGTTPLPGVFNVMSPPTTFADLLETCRRAGGGTATVRWTDDENVDDLGADIVQPRDGSDDGVFQLSCERALAAGYRPRPFAETARDTIDWARRTHPTFTSPH